MRAKCCGQRRAPAWAATLLTIVLPLAGCRPTINTTYGLGPNTPGASSVNGTAVLQTMFAEAGHRVDSWWRLSPRLKQRADVIVWFPSDYGAPSAQARDWLETWLVDQPGRTLIYVGRDFDAAPLYWRAMKQGAPARQLPAINQELQNAQSAFNAQRAGRPASEDHGWYIVQTQGAPLAVQSLHSPAGWADGVDATKLEMELNDRLVPREGAQTLLASGADVLVSRQSFGQGQLIVVANGSFLLNLPLVNHQHRKLAARLINEVGEQKRVYFLECGSSPSIVYEEEEFQIPALFQLFELPVLSFIILHLALAGVVFCFARFPIFGLPRRLPATGLSDFGEHVAALGYLLAKTQDTKFASERVTHYQSAYGGSRRDAARGRLEPKPAVAADTAPPTSPSPPGGELAPPPQPPPAGTSPADAGAAPG